jgi:hypothetical protein
MTYFLFNRARECMSAADTVWPAWRSLLPSASRDKFAVIPSGRLLLPRRTLTQGDESDAVEEGGTEAVEGESTAAAASASGSLMAAGEQVADDAVYLVSKRNLHHVLAFTCIEREEEVFMHVTSTTKHGNTRIVYPSFSTECPFRVNIDTSLDDACTDCLLSSPHAHNHTITHYHRFGVPKCVRNSYLAGVATRGRYASLLDAKKNLDELLLGIQSDLNVLRECESTGAAVLPDLYVTVNPDVLKVSTRTHYRPTVEGSNLDEVRCRLNLNNRYSAMARMVPKQLVANAAGNLLVRLRDGANAGQALFALLDEYKGRGWCEYDVVRMRMSLSVHCLPL